MAITRFVYAHKSDVEDGWHGDWVVAPYIDGEPTKGYVIEADDAAEAIFKVLGSVFPPSERSRITKVNVKRHVP